MACLFAIPKDMLENCDLAWALCDSLYDKTPSAAGYICSLSSAVHDLDVCMATWLEPSFCVFFGFLFEISSPDQLSLNPPFSLFIGN